mgnify:CR=1 FL=1
MNALTGFGLATLALVLFGLYMVPRKLTRLRDIPFSLTMCLGVVVSTLGANLLWHGQLLGPAEPRLAWLGFICGPVWYGGVLAYAISVTQMGLSIATPTKNTTAVLGTLIGLVYFAEWRETRPAPALAGAVLVVLCAVLLGRTGERNGQRSFVTPLGVVAAIAAAVLFAAYTIPFKLAQVGGLDTVALVAYMGVGTLVGALVCFAVVDRRWGEWLRARPVDHAYAALCGLLWVLAVMFMAEAIRRIGLAITWPFTNLNTVVTVACGVLLFHEIDVRRFGRVIALGLLAGVLGVVLLGAARLG